MDHYGVLVGVLTSHERDQPDNQGRWFHVKLTVRVGAQDHHVAVDVDSKQSAFGVEWKILRGLSTALFGPVAQFLTQPHGYHELVRAQGTGALDLIRHTAFISGWWIFSWMYPHRSRTWSRGSYVEASTALESILVPNRTILVWGEPYTNNGRRGMHNVHQNQGDPFGSRWWRQNAIWQDGGVMMLRPDGKLDCFVSKFASQSYATDDQGHPIS